ncbi:hypothetical protein AA101099_1789 [Neoasaia chiangmaiensis NBRC 101099]|uniref:Sulfate transporter n=1 Tax=Neoasaia chiangmaiensis TaxID=320497 RepID=A0A1U9KR82_9PROT|nr:DUF3164 family protein [Neoasaia chiangmaiensis]AQS88255.1 sulfate transporter [Neoasaia chiangmaiensis]GBR39720.1 hypothetical protein AA101099_1789 [Neoasaia chiangmaiensis NBRC 101099]GEN14711.1 sulfate transporter [Neoasaia chiangmaiensis]
MSHNPDDYMTDSAGRLVPRKNVRAEDLLQDELVRKLHEQAAQHREALRSFRETCFADIASLLDLLSEQYDAKKGGAKGNLTLSSYDGRLRVSICIGDAISFGPELQVAKELIDSCLTRWSEGANDNIRAIVMDAFDVGKEGHLSATKILALRRLSIDDDEWNRAMHAITASVKVDATRSYVRFHERVGQREPFVQVPLDMARA